MDMIILALTIAVFFYACYTHHVQDNTPEEDPARIILLFTFLSAVFQIGEIYQINWLSPYVKEVAWNLLSLFVLVRLINFLGDRGSRISEHTRIEHGRHKES